MSIRGLERMKSAILSRISRARISRAGLRLTLPIALMAVLTACVTPPPRVVSVPAPPPQRMFVYPANGQSPSQTERDRYECHIWAVQQTGVDPSRVVAYQQVIVQPANPPGSGAVGGAVVGAIIGSIIGGPYNSGAGFLLGGATGAIVGSAADANAQKQAQQTQQQINQNAAEARTQAEAYRRAMGSCLQGRGYTVS
jgi:outer membrane lipoprotein SlyB